MNQIRYTLISALGLGLRNQTAINRGSMTTSPMRQLSANELKSIVGGDDSTGPRGGWIAMASTSV